jgi:hypothetical protein
MKQVKPPLGSAVTSASASGVVAIRCRALILEAARLAGWQADGPAHLPGDLLGEGVPRARQGRSDPGFGGLGAL